MAIVSVIVTGVIMVIKVYLLFHVIILDNIKDVIYKVNIISYMVIKVSECYERVHGVVAMGLGW